MKRAFAPTIAAISMSLSSLLARAGSKCQVRVQDGRCAQRLTRALTDRHPRRRLCRISLPPLRACEAIQVAERQALQDRRTNVRRSSLSYYDPLGCDLTICAGRRRLPKALRFGSRASMWSPVLREPLLAPALQFPLIQMTTNTKAARN